MTNEQQKKVAGVADEIMTVEEALTRVEGWSPLPRTANGELPELSKQTAKNVRRRAVGIVLAARVKDLEAKLKVCSDLFVRESSINDDLERKVKLYEKKATSWFRNIASNRCRWTPLKSMEFCGISHCGACQARKAMKDLEKRVECESRRAKFQGKGDGK